MSSLEALHQIAPSLRGRRTRSSSVAVATRERLAQRDPREHEAALASMTVSSEGAEAFYDESLTVDEEEEGTSVSWLLLAAFLTGAAAIALASLGLFQ